MLPAMLSSSRASSLVTFAGCLMIPALASAQQPLRINIPYSCQDGITRTIQQCGKNARGGDVCQWREEKNGKLQMQYMKCRKKEKQSRLSAGKE